MSSTGPMLSRSRVHHNLHNPCGLRCQECNPDGLSRRGRRITKHKLRREEGKLWRRDFDA